VKPVSAKQSQFFGLQVIPLKLDLLIWGTVTIDDISKLCDIKDIIPFSKRKGVVLTDIV
jgi:hypothetical protein